MRTCEVSTWVAVKLAGANAAETEECEAWREAPERALEKNEKGQDLVQMLRGKSGGEEKLNVGVIEAASPGGK